VTQSLAGAIARVQTLADGISTLRLVPDYPPEKLAVAPAALVYMGAGAWHCEAMQKRWLGDIVLEVFVGRNQPDLARAFELLTGYAESVADALEGDPTLNNTCDQIVFPIRQEAPVMTQYADNEFVVVRWAIPVSVTNAIS
jgi:hypothetical protein